VIGVFDSGVGGLSVLREIRAQLPAADLLYFADQAHVPYGPRPAPEIRHFSEAITRFLLQRGAQVVVVACNTASAAALQSLRVAFPAVPFVGMEPAVKPAAARSRTRTVGVIATPATFQGELFASVVDRFAQGITVLPQVCPGLVEQVEAGALAAPDTLAMLRQYLTPLVEQGIDSLVLGCTHYAFLIPAIVEVVGPNVEIVDPAPAVARQVRRVAAGLGTGGEAGRLTLASSGEVEKLVEFAGACAGLRGEALPVGWVGPTLAPLPPAVRPPVNPPPA
jgi:glutamate racemase